MGKMSGGNDSTSKSMMTGDMKSDKDQSQKKSVSLDGGEEVIGISSCHGQSVEKNGDDQSKNRQEDEENGGFIHPFASVDELDPAISAHLHFLESFQAGKSKVELLAAKIEKRRKERIPVTFSARVEFLKTCRSIAVMKGYEKKTWIHYFDLLEYQRRVRQEVGSGCKPFKGLSKIEKYLRVINDKRCLLDVLDQAVYVVEKIQLEDNDWFHYQDFNFFHTYLASRWPWRRHRTLSAASTVLLFYIFSPILLCAIMKDQNICPSDANSLEMIRNALYFSSTTMSTVGKHRPEKQPHLRPS